MNWSSATEFWAMGGYGFFVWGSFLVCLLVMVVEPWMAYRQLRAAKSQLRRQVLAAQWIDEEKGTAQ